MRNKIENGLDCWKCKEQKMVVEKELRNTLFLSRYTHHLLSNGVLERPVNNSQNFDSVAYIA